MATSPQNEDYEELATRFSAHFSSEDVQLTSDDQKEASLVNNWRFVNK